MTWLARTFVLPVQRLFDRRYRGFRVVELAAGGVLCVLILGVYAFKADAGREDGKLADVDHQVQEETKRVRLLQADIARLERPDRLEHLSSAYLGLAPADAKREAPADSLADLARMTTAAPKPAPPPAAPAPVEAAR